jgi:hypothetical protein
VQPPSTLYPVLEIKWRIDWSFLIGGLDNLMSAHAVLSPDASVLVLPNQSSYVFDIGFESWALLSSPSPSFPGS